MFRQLFRPAAVVLTAAVAFTNLPRTLVCNQNWTPTWVYETGYWAGVCPPRTIVMIPSLVTSPGLKEVVVPIRYRMPDTTVMSNNRLELGKIIVAVVHVDTPQSKQAVEAVKRFDDQARTTILNIAKFNAASELTSKTAVHILEGLIETLTQASSPYKSATGIDQIVSFQQDLIDAWVKGLQDQLRRLYEQGLSVQVDLGSCDNHLLQIFWTAGVAKDEREKRKEEILSDAPGFFKRLFSGDDRGTLKAPVSRAIEDFAALIVATQKAQQVVEDLSKNLVMVMEGIQEAYRYHDQMLVLEMSMKDKVNIALESLRRFKGDIERAQTGR